MNELKYYLWTICMIMCFSMNTYANNDQCTPIDMNANPNYIGSCTNDSNIGSNENSSSSVWYKFQTDVAGEYEIKITNATFCHLLYLLSVDCVNGNITKFIPLPPSVEGGFGFVGTSLIRNLPANTTYTFVVNEANCAFEKTRGTFCVEVNHITPTPPINEECNTATQIDLTTEACITGSNRYASDADPQPSCNPHSGASVWYQISAPASGMIRMETFPNFSEVITVYEGTCGNLTEILCSVNGDNNDGTLIINDLTPDDAYYIQVTGNFPTIEADNGLVCDDNYITISTDFDCPEANTVCDDGNPNTTNDVWDDNCNCEGTCANNIGDICDDGDDATPYDFWDADCNCQDQCPRTVADCPNSDYVINSLCKCECNLSGTPCSGSDPNKEYVWNDACECIQNTPGGLGYCPTDITLDAENVSNDTYFQTSDYIETDGSVIVEVGEDLTLNAKNYIKLTPGFNAKAESTMRAYIDGCEPTVERAEELTTASVKHYPNPFRDEVTLEFKLDLDADIEIMITDVNGKIVSRLSIDNLYRGIQTHSISTQNWIPGIYFYKVLIKEQQTGILKRANGTLVKM